MKLAVKIMKSRQLDVNFQKLAARGISMIISSGDDGAGCKPTRRQALPILASIKSMGNSCWCNALY